MGCVLCEHCTAICCKSVSLPIEIPETPQDYDDIRWYLAHEGVAVFVEDGQWYITFAGRCQYLQADNRCAIYRHRPRICREYSTSNCDYHGGDYAYEHLFTTPDEIMAYARRAPADAKAHKKVKSNRKRHRTVTPEKPVVWDLPQ